MGTISHVALCVLFLYIGVSEAMFDDKASAEDPLGFEEVDRKFADIFVKKVLENKDFKLKDDNDDDLKEVVDILLNSIKKLKNLGDADEVEKRAIMNAFATGIATVIIDHTDSSEYSPEKKTAIVVDAMRDAFRETGQKPSESLIGDVEFMTGVLLSLRDKDSSSDDSDDSEPEVTTTTPEPATSPPPKQDTTENAPTGSTGSDESSQSSSRSPSSSSSQSAESSSESGSSQSESLSPSENSQSESSRSNSSESDLEDSAPTQTDPTPEPGHQFPKDMPSKPSGTVKPLSPDGTGPVGKIGPYGDLGPIEHYGTLSDIGPMDNIGPKGKLHVYPHTPGGNIIIMSSDKKKPRHKSTPARAATGSTLPDKSPESQGPTPTPPETITTAKDPITGTGDQIPQNKPASSGGNDNPIPSNGSGLSGPPSVTSARGVTTASPDRASEISSEFVPTQPPATNSAPNGNQNENVASEKSPPSPSPSKAPEQKSESSSTQAPISANNPEEKQNLQDSAPGDSSAPSSDNVQSSEGQETASAPSANTADSPEDPLQNKGQKLVVSDVSNNAPEPSKAPEQKPERESTQALKSGNDPEEKQDLQNSSPSCCSNPPAPESNPLGNTSPSESNPDEDELYQDSAPDQSSNQAKSPSQDSPQKPGKKPVDSSVVPGSATTSKSPEPSKAPLHKADSGTPQAPESNSPVNKSPSENSSGADNLYQDATPDQSSNQEKPQSQDLPQKPGEKPLDSSVIPQSSTTPKAPEPSKAPIHKAASGSPQAPESNSLGNTSPSESNPDDKIYQDANPEDSNQAQPTTNDPPGGSQSTSPPSVTSANPSTDSPQKPGPKPLDAEKVPVSSTKPTESSTTPLPTSAPDSNPPVDSSPSSTGSDELLEDSSPNDSDEEDSNSADDDENERPQGAFPQQTPGWGSGSKPPPGPTMLSNVREGPQGPQGAGTFKKPKSNLRSTGPSSNKPSPNNDQFLPFGDFIKIFNATMHGGNKRNPYYVNTILKSKKSKPGTLNYRELVKDLSAMFGAMRYDHQLPFSDLYVQMLLELLYAALDIIRSSDSSCLHHPKGDPQIREYARALYDVLI